MKSVGIQFFLLIVFITISLGIASGAILWSKSNDEEGKIVSNGVGSPKSIKNISSLSQKIEKVEINNQFFKVGLANTVESRSQGLSGRQNLDQDSGLLFLFDKSDRYGFWMKDMNFPIDIIWIDEDGLIVHLEKNLKPETFPKVFLPKLPAISVLEINAGLIDKYKIKLGSKVTFLP